MANNVVMWYSSPSEKNELKRKCIKKWKTDSEIKNKMGNTKCVISKFTHKYLINIIKAAAGKVCVHLT